MVSQTTLELNLKFISFFPILDETMSVIAHIMFRADRLIIDSEVADLIWIRTYNVESPQE